jgi:hypothetical protein
MNIDQDDLYDVAGYLQHLESVVAQQRIDTANVIAGLQEARNVLSRALTSNQADALERRARDVERRAKLAELQAKYPARPIITVAGE